MQGKQVDNALAGKQAATETDPVHLFTPHNIDKDGGKHDVFDPDNGYKSVFRKIWGKAG